jgi:hypothetical protein
MFKRKVQVVHQIELDDETKQALTKLESDLQVVEGFLKEVADQGRAILSALQGQALNPDVEEAEFFMPELVGEPAERVKKDEDEITYTTKGTVRRRMSPFNRVPRHIQVEWLLDLLADGEWHHPHQIAKEYSNDEREYRYLRSAVSTRLREMMEEDRVEREEGTAKGSMFRYRLKQS